MSQYTQPVDLAATILDLRRRVAELERRQTNPLPAFTTAARPAAASVPGLVIRNLTTGTAEFSNGSTWATL